MQKTDWLVLGIAVTNPHVDPPHRIVVIEIARALVTNTVSSSMKI